MLTEKRIRDARAADKTTFIWDSRVKNFGVRITGKGAKSYVLFYRTGGRKHLATLTRCSEVSLAEARQRAGRELAAIRDGEADPLERRRKTREAPTVNDALDRLFNETAPARIEAGRMTERTMREYGEQATAMSGRRSARCMWRRSRATTSNASRRRRRRHRRNAIERSPSSLGCSRLPSIGCGATNVPTPCGA